MVRQDMGNPESAFPGRRIMWLAPDKGDISMIYGDCTVAFYGFARRSISGGGPKVIPAFLSKLEPGARKTSKPPLEGKRPTAIR
jgi:hypothetical protein